MLGIRLGPGEGSLGAAANVESDDHPDQDESAVDEPEDAALKVVLRLADECAYAFLIVGIRLEHFLVAGGCCHVVRGDVADEARPVVVIDRPWQDVGAFLVVACQDVTPFRWKSQYRAYRLCQYELYQKV